MHLLYLDESGVPERHASQTSHYVLIGLSVYEGTWFALNSQVSGLKRRFSLGSLRKFELHAAWLLRPYAEQEQILGFESLTWEQRASAVRDVRGLRRQKWPQMPPAKRRAEQRYQRQTNPYIHLTYGERREVVAEALSIVGRYRKGINLFGAAIDKTTLSPRLDPITEAFTQTVSRFESFLRKRKGQHWGMLVVDEDPNSAHRLTKMLKRFQEKGTPWGAVDRVIESPFMLDSSANSGVQVVDICAYAVRRYLEKGEEERLNAIYKKFYRTGTGLHGMRHLTAKDCRCRFCTEKNERKAARKKNPRGGR